MTIRLNWITVKDYIINIIRAKGYYVDPWLLPRITEYYRVLPDGHDVLEGFPFFSDKNLMWGFLNGICRFSLCEKYKMNFIAYSRLKKDERSSNLSTIHWDYGS